MPTNYDTEIYWDEMADHINSRDDLKTVAGDDEPYYRDKRRLFLLWLDKLILLINPFLKSVPDLVAI